MSGIFIKFLSLVFILISLFQKDKMLKAELVTVNSKAKHIKLQATQTWQRHKPFRFLKGTWKIGLGPSQI